MKTNENRYDRELKKTIENISAALSAAGLLNWQACESFGLLDENLQLMDDPPFCSVRPKIGLGREQTRAVCKAEHVKVGKVLRTLHHVAIDDQGGLGGWQVRPMPKSLDELSKRITDALADAGLGGGRWVVSRWRGEASPRKQLRSRRPPPTSGREYLFLESFGRPFEEHARVRRILVGMGVIVTDLGAQGWRIDIETRKN